MLEDNQNTDQVAEPTEEEAYDKAYYGDDYEQKSEAGESTEEALPDVGDDELVKETEEPILEVDEEEAPAPVYKTIKINGKEVEATEEELIALAQKGFDYTKKTQELADKRRELEKFNGIDERDVEMLKRAKAGDRTALAALSKSFGVDPLELLDVNADDFKAMQQTATVVPSQEVKEIFESIQGDTQLIGKLRDAETHLPRQVMEAAVQDPRTMRAIIEEVQSGDYEIVQPHLDKQLALLSDMDRGMVTRNPQAYANFYVNVKQGLIDQYQKSQAHTEATKTSKPKPNLAEVGIQKSGATPSTRSTPKESDAWSDDDAYQKVLNRLNGN